MKKYIINLLATSLVAIYTLTSCTSHIGNNNAKEINPKNVKIGEKIGQGGYGEVFKANWQDSTVAVKQLMDVFYGLELEDRNKIIDQFKKEASMMLDLDHPNIVRCYGFFSQPRMSIVIEYMPKGSLDNCHMKKINLPWGTRISIALDIAKGLEFLHEKKIIHGDLKSLNVLLNENYTAKICDFGLAKTKHSTQSILSKTTNNGNKGTWNWMAPELFDEGSTNKKTDVYSLGIVLWEISTAKNPYEGWNAGKVTFKVTQGFREKIPIDVPKGFDKVIEKCWSGDSEVRPSMDIVVPQLEEIKKIVFQEEWPSIPKNLHNGMGFKEKFKLNKVNPIEVQMFLDLVALGQQSKAEEMLKKNPWLALEYGTLTDHAKRMFEDISGFQYAIWALDWHMWEMIGKYLSSEDIAKQIEKITTGKWVKEHEEYVNWNNLIYVQKNLFANWDKWNWRKIDEHWIQKIGGAQLLLPMHALQEYCQPGRPFSPCPNFKDDYYLERNLPDWLDKGIKKYKLGENWAIFRSDGEVSHSSRIGGLIGHGAYGKNNDWWDEVEQIMREDNEDSGWVNGRHHNGSRISCEGWKSLLIIRSKQRENLILNKSISNQKFILAPKSCSIQEFLEFIKIGKQAEVEEVLQSNPKLALVSGTIIDHAQRIFKDITGLQYALWALDWHMWVAIIKYLSAEQMRIQIKKLEIASWVKEYGVHSGWLMEQVIDGLQTLRNNWGNWDWDKKDQYWIKHIGKLQSILPVNILQEYSQPNRPFNPSPNFWDSYELNRFLPDWLMKSYIEKKLPHEWAIYRHYRINIWRTCSASHFDLSIGGWGSVGFRIEDDLALKNLLKTRISQREDLLAEINKL